MKLPVAQRHWGYRSAEGPMDLAPLSGRSASDGPASRIMPQQQVEFCQRMCRLRYPSDLRAQVECFERHCWR